MGEHRLAELAELRGELGAGDVHLLQRGEDLLGLVLLVHPPLGDLLTTGRLARERTDDHLLGRLVAGEHLPYGVEVLLPLRSGGRQHVVQQAAHLLVLVEQELDHVTGVVGADFPYFGHGCASPRGPSAGRWSRGCRVSSRSRCGATVYFGSSADAIPASKTPHRVIAEPTSISAPPIRASTGRRRPAAAAAAPAARNFSPPFMYRPPFPWE